MRRRSHGSKGAAVVGVVGDNTLLVAADPDGIREYGTAQAHGHARSQVAATYVVGGEDGCGVEGLGGGQRGVDKRKLGDCDLGRAERTERLGVCGAGGEHHGRAERAGGADEFCGRRVGRAIKSIGEQDENRICAGHWGS